MQGLACAAATRLQRPRRRAILRTLRLQRAAGAGLRRRRPGTLHGGACLPASCVGPRRLPSSVPPRHTDAGCAPHPAAQWRIVPGKPFPTASWAAGSGSIYCEGGSFCTNTTTALECPRRHFCRQGTTAPERCPPGAPCPAGTEFVDGNLTGESRRGRRAFVSRGELSCGRQPLEMGGCCAPLDSNAPCSLPPRPAGVSVDALLFGLLWLAWLLAWRFNTLQRRLSARERIRITW